MKKQEPMGNDEFGNIIMKKRITETSSQDKKNINTTATNQKQLQLQYGKNQKKNQEQIMLNIENNNIKNHVQEMLKKFNPPKCFNCENRTADRVCINKTCSRNNYMQLICGKCHFKEHQDSINKPEIDLEEFFIKLATFLNEQKYTKEKSYSFQNANPEYLTKSLDDIKRLRQKLNELIEKLKAEVEDHQRPEEMHNNISNSITKALSLCEYDNVQDQLNFIKKSVLFNGNKFAWNDCHEKYKSMNGLIDKIENNTTDISKSINKSLSQPDMSIDLTNVNVLRSNFDPFSNSDGIKTKLIDNELYFTNISYTNQSYLNYKLNQKCKYKIRFRFEQQPNQYIVVGVTPKSKANSWIYDFECHFCKIFYHSSPENDCSRILKGQDMSSSIFKKGDQFEMRVDFQNYYMDFYDYPEMKNINANQLDNKVLPNESFVLVVSMYASQCIVLESIEEIDEIIDFIY